MQITAVLIAVLAGVATANKGKHHQSKSSSTDSDTASSSSSSSSTQMTSQSHHDMQPTVYYPRKGKFVVVKIKSNYAAYPSVCYKNGFKPAVVSRRSLPMALGAVKEACVERAWIRRYEPCQGCDYPKSVAWDEKLNGRVELWERDGEKAYALCQKTNEQICKETGKCCRKYKSGKSNDICSESSESDSRHHDRPSKPHKAAEGKKEEGKKEAGKKEETGKKTDGKKQPLKKKAGKKDCKKDCN